MDMGTGMGQWLLWGVLGLIGLLALIGLGSSLRKNKKKYVVASGGNTGSTAIAGDSGARITETAANISADASDAVATSRAAVSGSSDIAGTSSGMARSSTSNIVTDINSKSSSWGFWPWALISALVLAGLAWVVWNTHLTSGQGMLKWIMWSLLGLAGLFSFLGIAQMTRRHPMVDEKRGSPRGLGFITLISGLALGLASWFVWQPKVAGLGNLQVKVDNYAARANKLKIGNTRLSGVVGKNKGTIAKLRARNLVLKDKLAARNKSGSAATGRLEGVIAGLRKSNATKTAENTRLAGLLSNGQSYGDEVTRLNGVIARLTKNNTDMTTENARLNTMLDGNKSDSSEIGKLNGVIAGLNKDNGDIKTENGRMQDLIGTYKNDNEVQGAKIAALEAELTALRNKPAPAAVVASAPRSIVKRRHTPLGLIHKYNQDETKMRLTSGDYNMVKSPKVEMVNGKRGHYYDIFLKNPANGKAYNFASASYSKIVNDGQFKQSLDRVISDIRGALDGKRKYQIYVKGKASAGRYNGKMAEGFDYPTVTVLENKDGSFGPGQVERTYGPEISNDDLPNLRGAFLQEYVGKNYKVAKPIILDGTVSKSKNARNQAVALTLFVED